MKLVIEHQPWQPPDAQYPVFYLIPDGRRQAVRRFATEAEARAWCEMRVAGPKIVAEFEVPDGS